MSQVTHPLRHVSVCLLIALFCFLAVGCTSPTTPTAPPTPSTVAEASPTSLPVAETATVAAVPADATATVAPLTSTATMESVATEVPVEAAVTPTVPTTTVAQCQPIQPPDVGAPLPSVPDLNALAWEAQTIGGQSVRVLTGLGLSPTDSTVSPSGEELALALQYENDFRGAIAVANINDNSAWWATQNTFISLAETRVPLVEWSATGQAVWADETGMVYVGNGTDATSLNAPEPMAQVLELVGNVAFTISQADSALWRLDMATVTWEAVTTATGEPIMTNSSYVQLAQDSSYLLVAESAEQLTLVRVPVSMGAGAERVTATIEPYNVVGSGRVPSRPAQISNSDVWVISLPLFPDEPFNVGEYALWEENFAVNSSTGERITLADFPAFGDYDFLHRFTVSKDGEWLALTLFSRTVNEAGEVRKAVYVTPADAWAEGQLIEGVVVVDMLAEPDALLVVNPPDNTLHLYALPLTAEPTAVRLNEATLINTVNVVATAPNRIYTHSTGDQTRILAFDGMGQPLGSLILTPPYSKITSATASAEKLFVGVARPDANEDCLYEVVEWQP